MMGYRIARIAGVHYENAIQAFLSQEKNIEDLCYEDQKKNLFSKAVTYSDSFARTMSELGNEAVELIYDFSLLQKTWARENNITFSEKSWRSEILLRQIEWYRPDILFFQDIHSLSYKDRKILKRIFPFIRLICVYKGFPGAFDELENVDLLFAGYPLLAEQFRKNGLNAHVIYHAFDPRVLDYLKTSLNQNATYDFTFVGSSGFGYGGHKKRYHMLAELIERTQLRSWVDDREGGMIDDESKLPGLVRNALSDYNGGVISSLPLPSAPLKKRYPACCKPAVHGLDMFDILACSKITLNIHTDAVIDNVANKRMFEATGVGSCMILENGTNIRDLFDPDVEVITYESIDECVEKVTYLLENEDVCRCIAGAGQKRTLKDHTIINRYQEIDGLIREVILSL